MTDLAETKSVRVTAARPIVPPLPSTGTTVREAHVSCGETISWRAWEAIGQREGKGNGRTPNAPVCNNKCHPTAIVKANSLS